jgi:Na+-driven multidrug efflux pump
MIGIPVVRVVAFSMVIMSAATVWLYAVTGTGSSRVTFTIELITIIVYCIYIYLVLEYFKLSILWGWASELLYWSFLLSLSYLYMKSRRWTGKVV